MKCPIRLTCGSLILFALALSVARPGAFAQSQASCTFKLFPINITASTSLSPNGVNDYSTIVGQAFTGPPSNVSRGFTRYSGGGISYYSAPNAAATYFTDRNDGGINIGVYSSNGPTSNIPKGFMLHGSTFTSIVHPKGVWGTTVTGINKYNSIVGWYAGSGAGASVHGFKRFSNGGFATLDYPGGQYTTPTGINDRGFVAGWFSDSTGARGFIYHNGQWAPLDYGTTRTTQVYGISNAGVIIGMSTATEPGVAFLYKNGTFKVMSVPKSFSTKATGISANGLITGVTNLDNTSSGSRGFTATCQ